MSPNDHPADYLKVVRWVKQWWILRIRELIIDFSNPSGLKLVMFTTLHIDTQINFYTWNS